MVNPSNVKVGDKIWVDGLKRPFRVKARDSRYIIATKPFNPKHTVLYFIIDLVRGVRGRDNMIFCFGYETDEQVQERLKDLQSGTAEVTYRNSVDSMLVDKIEVKE